MLTVKRLLEGSSLLQGVRAVFGANARRSMSDGRMFNEEEKAKETQYIRKMEAEKIEKARKEAAEALKKLDEKHKKIKEDKK